MDYCICYTVDNYTNQATRIARLDDTPLAYHLATYVITCIGMFQQQQLAMLSDEEGIAAAEAELQQCCAAINAQLDKVHTYVYIHTPV